MAAFNAKVAFNRDKAEHVEFQAADQAGHLTVGTVQVQFQVGGGAGGHFECGVAQRLGVCRAGREAVVDHGAVFGCAVDLQAHVIDLNGQALYAHKGGLIYCGLRRGPAAGLGACRLQAGEFFADDHQAQVHVVQAHTHGAGQQLAVRVVAAAHAGKGVELVATKGEHIGGQGLAVAERHALAARDDGKFTASGHKAGDVEVEHAARFHELAVATVQGKCKAFVTVGHGEHRGVFAVVHHQSARGLGRGGDGAARLHGFQRDRLGHSFVRDHQGGHIGTQQTTGKAQLQLAACVKAQAGRGTGDAGQGRCDRSLHLVLGHVGTQGAGGDGAAAMRQAQRVINQRLGAGNDHALHLAVARLALGQVGGRDDRQAEVACGIAGRAKVAADIGHIGVSERATKGECEAGFTRVGTGLRGHGDLACAKQRVHARLQVGTQLRRVGAVADGWAVGAHTVQLHRDLEAALGQLSIDRDGTDHHRRDIRACERAAKAHQVSVSAARGDADRAQVAQGGGAGRGRAQGGLHGGSTRAKGDAA